MTNNERHYERGLERHTLAADGVVRVIDTGRELEIGQLVNIHTEGMMMMGPDLVAEDHLYQVVLELPQKINGRSRISLGIDCLWTKMEAGKLWSGFQIIDISDESRADILGLIEKLG